MIWLLLLAWILASFICGGLWAIAGLRMSRMQERNATPNRLVYYEMEPSEYRRLN